MLCKGEFVGLVPGLPTAAVFLDGDFVPWFFFCINLTISGVGMEVTGVLPALLEVFGGEMIFLTALVLSGGRAGEVTFLSSSSVSESSVDDSSNLPRRRLRPIFVQSVASCRYLGIYLNSQSRF